MQLGVHNGISKNRRSRLFSRRPDLSRFEDKRHNIYQKPFNIFLIFIFQIMMIRVYSVNRKYCFTQIGPKCPNVKLLD